MSENETLIAWMGKIDERIQALDLKLNSLASTSRVEALENRTRHLEAKVAGVAATMTAIGLGIYWMIS